MFKKLNKVDFYLKSKIISLQKNIVIHIISMILRRKFLLAGAIMLAISLSLTIYCNMVMPYGNHSVQPLHPAEPEMIFVQGGTFRMGCTAEQGDDCWDEEKPVHQVTVSSFSMGKYEITQRQWESLMGTTIWQQRDKAANDRYEEPDHLPIHGDGKDYPVYYVSWDDAQEFITRLNAATGKQYRLPTEAEWEYAARGGAKSNGFKYSGSNHLDEVAWYWDNNSETAHPVGEKMPNELGIYDMSGNVWEWCHSWYENYAYSSKSYSENAPAGTPRTVRGGSWYNVAEDARVSFRNSDLPENRRALVGFRLACSSK